MDGVIVSLMCLSIVPLVRAVGRDGHSSDRLSLRPVRLSSESNPLLTQTDDSFPPYDKVHAEHVSPAIHTLLQQAKRELASLEERVQYGAFKDDPVSLLKPYRMVGYDLYRAFRLCSHLKSVKDSKELRDAIEGVRPSIVEFGDQTSQSKTLYHAFKALQEDEQVFKQLTRAQKRLVQLEVQGFELSGVGLSGASLEEFNNITQTLSKLTTAYSENELDATKKWSKLVDSVEALGGLPEAPLQLAEAAALEKHQQDVSGTSFGEFKGGNAGSGHDNLTDRKTRGPFLLTLDAPSVSAVLTYVEDAKLREEVYLASTSKASELAGPDNTPVLRQILNLRQRHAEILGFQNYVQLSMQRKMATYADAGKLLEDLRVIAYPKAKQDLEDLQGFAADRSQSGELHHWDLSFWSNKQAKHLFNIDPEELRPYFPLNQSLQGLFGLASQMYDIQFMPTEGPKWHDDVMLFGVYHRKETQPFAHVYMDLFTRPKEKKSGAWQAEVRAYDAERSITPIATIVANFRPAASGQPALLSFGELHTLFHETGHALQTILTKQREPSLTGTTGVEWDAVELPSQFNEYFLDETDMVVDQIAQHYKTGEKLDKKKLESVKASQKHHAGMGMLGQLHLSLLDLDLHTNPLKPDETPHDRDVSFGVSRKTKLLPALANDRFLCHFNHIFSGGYAAGYYSYKWAEVLSADAFDAFESAGATDKRNPNQQRKLREVGLRFADTVLGEGGGRPAAEIFHDFRGRDPSTSALLRYNFGGSEQSLPKK